MPSVVVKAGESFESVIRRFKRAVEKAGIPKELRKREFHIKGAVKKQREKAAARKRWLKKILREKQVREELSRDRRR